MIERFEDLLNYNPIREHLEIFPLSAGDDSEKISSIVMILNENFDIEKSRAIIFCSSRKKTEQIAELLTEVNKEISIAPFHAGMSGEERNNTYQEFLRGEISILSATKAFGMGMDIPNIHYIFHFDPPSSLEDYLQEVGRAGRDAKCLEDAGFSLNNPINCYFFANEKSFKRKRDLIHRSTIRWDDIVLIFNNLLDQFNLVKPINSILPVSNNFLGKLEDFRDSNDKANLLRMSLHWLETLQRVKLLNYLPVHLEFESIEIPETEKNTNEKIVLDIIENYRKNNFADSMITIVPIVELLNHTSTGSYDKLFGLLARMHDKKMIKMAQSIRIKITEQRTKEMQVAEENRNSRYIYLEAYLKIVSSLIKAAALDEKIEINENDINELLEKTFKEFITQENFSWLTEEYFLKNEEKFRRSFGGGYRIKSLISLINSFQGIHINQKVLDQEKILIISKDNQFVSEELDQFSMYSLSLLQRIYNLFKQNREFNVFDELLSLNTPDLSLEYLESSLLFLKGIGYINFNSPLLHMGIEVQFTNFEPIDSESGEGDDYKVNQIFNEYNYLKKLRIYSLEIFANLQSNEDRTQFITEYFECDNSKNILALFENFVPKADNVNHILSELRQEALNKEVEGVYDEKTNTKIGGLNEKQLEIYKSDPNNSLSVIAGPGTGKTHTLIMCIVRLIHEFNVKPEKILVLAYNRAIVNELKHRINSLLRKLGYGNLARGIKIHTFHSLVKYCLHDLVKDIDVNKWIETFNNDYAEHAGIISNRLQNPQYFFVDEYQDISKERLDMLNHINSKKPTMVIGDPDQSIYGYERKLHSADISAVPYFQKFIQQNDAKKMYLNMNYRSTEEIISEVSRIIDKNEDRMNTEILVGLDKSKNPQSLEKIEISDFDYESIVNRLIKLINETKSNVEKYQDCAVLFRTNSELYYFNSLLLKNESLKNHEIIIQGSSTNFFKLREISILVDQIRKHSGKSFDEFYNNIFEATIERILKKYSKWNPRTFEVFKSLIEEFKASSVGSITVGDLLNYFDEIRDVDDAGLYKLVQMQQLSNSDNTRIILSTIHKSKGLEFDSVILPFSIVELPFKEKDPQFFDEERRLLYVATSRAKNKLIIYRSERERALDSNTSFELDTSKFPQNGLLCPNRLGSIIISSGVSDEKCHWLGFVSRKAYLKYINDEVIQSDNLEIEFDNGWFLTHASHKLFKMSNNFNEFIATKFTPDPGLILKGLFCSNVVRYYYSDSVVYDEINNTNYSNDWDHEAQEMGYIYLVGFEGFLHE